MHMPADSDIPTITGGSDDDFLFTVRDVSLRLPRPPSQRSPRSPPSPLQDPRTTTPSSGHFSAGSKVSSPSPDTATGVVRLHRELDALRRRHSQEQGQWQEERSGLEAQLASCHHGHLTDQRLEHFPLIEEKIREVLAMLRSLNTMKISEALLGRLVLDAVEKAYNPVIREVAVSSFLSLLPEHQGPREAGGRHHADPGPGGGGGGHPRHQRLLL